MRGLARVQIVEPRADLEPAFPEVGLSGVTEPRSQSHVEQALRPRHHWAVCVRGGGGWACVEPAAVLPHRVVCRDDQELASVFRNDKDKGHFAVIAILPVESSELGGAHAANTADACSDELIHVC